MSKKQQEATAPIAPAPLEPSRTLGLLILLVSIIFTVVWLTRESLENTAITIETPTVAGEISGFSADAWYLASDASLGFVEIPAGEFKMGSDPMVDRQAYGNERWSRRLRQGSVNLPTYFISRYETTVAQYSAYLTDTGLASSALNLDAPGNFPITGVTWPEALAYARWLEDKLKNSAQTPQILKDFLDSGAKVTLPSEAEWEKAARGSDGRVYPWGSRVRTDVANYNSKFLLGVGALPCDSCSYGLADMSGNVWEMTRSPLQDYPYTTENDMESLGSDAIWVMRGGSYADQVNNVRAAVRGGIDPGVRNGTIGFRLVISSL